ncbi:hypothetical protein [Actinocorallia populi]|uniref:hypothetical protein n=1 Tax=Actinocorallia populi TaxID=2079200 RepID=UPI000D094EBB|nr:hypothetical protein [Actinocorallia populi]
MRYRLTVVARDPADIVRRAGGWMVDRAFTGWEVRVLTAGGADLPMRILGADRRDLESALEAPVREHPPAALAVELELYDSDPRVRRMVRAAVGRGASDCRFWSASEVLDDGAGVVRYRLSAAARAFKVQALSALALEPGETGCTETFRPLGTFGA